MTTRAPAVLTNTLTTRANLCWRARVKSVCCASARLLSQVPCNRKWWFEGKCLCFENNFNWCVCVLKGESGVFWRDWPMFKNSTFSVTQKIPHYINQKGFSYLDEKRTWFWDLFFLIPFWFLKSVCCKINWMFTSGQKFSAGEIECLRWDGWPLALEQIANNYTCTQTCRCVCDCVCVIVFVIWKNNYAYMRIIAPAEMELCVVCLYLSLLQWIEK